MEQRFIKKVNPFTESVRCCHLLPPPLIMPTKKSTLTMIYAFLVALILAHAFTSLAYAHEEPPHRKSYPHVQTVTSLAYADDEFPLRRSYPHVQTISTEELKAKYQDTIQVDARSTVEYRVIHMEGAISIPYSSSRFISKLTKLRQENPSKPLVLYCNGHSCSVSYKAVSKALEHGIKNIFSYDSGILTWVKANPAQTVLLDESPADLSKLISKAQLKNVQRSLPELRKIAQDNNALIIDIREKHQMKALPKLDHIKHIKLNKLLFQIASKIHHDRTLIFIDATGKQLRWVQYYLEQQGYKSYYFLKGGVNALDKGSITVNY